MRLACNLSGITNLDPHQVRTDMLCTSHLCLQALLRSRRRGAEGRTGAGGRVFLQAASSGGVRRSAEGAMRPLTFTQLSDDVAAAALNAMPDWWTRIDSDPKWRAYSE